MNNLKQQLVESINSSNLLNGVSCLTIDSDLNVIYCINCEKQLISIDINNDNSTTKCCDLNVDQSVNAICVEFLSEERSVCIAFTNGDLINYNIINNNKQFVGSLSDGLQSVSFSLDQELIVLLTQNNSLILMSKLFDILAERDLNTEEFGLNKAVSVNWGSKATQFHGEGQRDSRSQKQDFESIKTSDDGKSRISWRGDGLYFVTSLLDLKTNKRKLQVWSRDAILQYTSEDIPGLENVISWKPSGNLIASSQLLPNKHLIIFFEKNGLKHGEFELPFSPNTFQVELISWSLDSQILLIIGSESVQQIEKQILMLWTQSNYHWYLKHRTQFTDQRIVSSIWDPIDNSLLHLLLSSGQYIKYRWKWSLDVCNGSVAVVDAKSLKLSNFDETVVPPPFYTYSLDLKAQVLYICFSVSRLAVILSDDTILLFKKTPKNQLKDSQYFSVTYQNINKRINDIFDCFYFNSVKDVSKLTNLIISEDDILYGTNGNDLVCFDFRKDIIAIDKVLSLKCNAICMSSKENIIAIVQMDGKLMKFDINTQTIENWRDNCETCVTFPQKCRDLELFKLEGRLHSICLSENYSLYLDNCVLAQNNCNSFIKFNDRFLLFSTTDHLLHCWPLNNNIFDVNKNYQNYRPRSVERGSKIIAASVSDAKIILSMPRGNLEAIHPRMLLIDSVMFRLDRLEFDIAFELLRKHRINLNFIYDYNPKIFNENIELFITQLGDKSIEWICLFLTDLTNEDIYVKLCSNNTNKSLQLSIPKSDNSLNKMDIICDSMRVSMDKMDANKYLHPILLTYIKKSIPETDNALKRIKAIDDFNIRDEAIKFLLYVIKIDKLFEDALGTYDFDILLMIASKSQKDPKEYLALLEELNAYESFDYKCYKIDMHLKRYKRALAHICKCDEHFEECLQLIQSHSLYRDAIFLFENRPQEQKNRIWKLYGDYLLNKKYFEEAAIAFKRCNDFMNAVKAYQLSGNWSAAIDAAYKCSDAINIANLASNFAKHLISIGKYSDASYLFEVYVKDHKQSIKTLINGHEWEHAIRLLNQYSDKDLDQYLRLELRNHCDITLDIITTNLMNLSKHKTRLETVRQEKVEKSLDFNTNYDNFDHKSDIYSDTSSLSDSNTSSQRSSSSSIATKKSKRNTKKLEKKKYRLKEGSVDEDIQLIFAMNEIIKNSDRMQEDVALLIRTLYDLCFTEEAIKVQKEFILLIDLINFIIKDIWPPNDPQIQVNDFSQRHQISDPELSKAPDFRKIDWKLVLI